LNRLVFPKLVFCRREDLGKVYGLDAGALPVQTAEDVHEAGIIDCGADFGAGIFDAAKFVGEHGSGDIAVLHGEGATETATLVHGLQLHQIDAADIP
jgi:hypothetical protein